MPIIASIFITPVDAAIVGGVVLLLFGGQKIAGFGKSVGQGIKDFKREIRESDEPPAQPTPTVPVSTGPTDSSKVEV